MKSPTVVNLDPKVVSIETLLTFMPHRTADGAQGGKSSAEAAAPSSAQAVVNISGNVVVSSGSFFTRAVAVTKAQKRAAAKRQFLTNRLFARQVEIGQLGKKTVDREIKELYAHLLSGASAARGSGWSLVESIEQGLPWDCFANVREWVGVSEPELLGIIGVAPRTAARRKQNEHFTKEESDRLARVARVMAQAVRVFEDADKAQRWMVRPHSWFGGKTPLSLLDTDFGAEQVTDELGRIEYGELVA